MTTDQHYGGAAEPGTNRLGTAGGRLKPSFSQFGHWAWMNKTLTDAGWRYYCAVRSFIFDADEDFEVDITDEVIAELLGKSARSIGRARRDCYDAGVIEELSFWKESVRIEGKARPEVRTFRRLIVHHEVPEGYDGPINAYREKRRIEQRRTQEQKAARERREQERHARRRHAADEEPPGPQEQRESDRTDLSGQTDQAQQDSAVSAEDQCDPTDLSESGTDLSESGTDLSSGTPSDLLERGSNQPYHQPCHQPSTREKDVDGGMDAPHNVNDTENDPPVDPTHRAHARRLLDAIRAQYPDWHPRQDEAEKLIVEAYAGGGTDELIRKTLCASFGGVNNTGRVMTHRLRTRLPSRSRPAVAAEQPQKPAALPPPCGACDARPKDPVSARVVWLDADRVRRCTRCHPDAIAEAVRDLQNT